MTSFASIIQDYIASKKWAEGVFAGRMIALMGDAELDEGNVYECLQEGWKHDLRNVWWVIDYNRQSLDGIIHEGLWEKVQKTFEAFGWEVVRLKYGALQEAAFAEAGGKKLKNWIDACPNQDFSALIYMGGAVWRERLLSDLGDQGDFSALINRRTDDELATLMENWVAIAYRPWQELFPGFHMIDPCFLAYTIKGWGTPIAGHKDNHGGLMTKDQMANWQNFMGVRQGNEWERFEGIEDQSSYQEWLDEVPFFKT